jgi:hypothetical protein
MQQIKHYTNVLNLLFSYCMVKIKFGKKSNNLNKKIYFDVHNVRGSLSVYYHNLIYSFIISGYSIHFIDNIRFLGQVSPLIRKLLKHPSVFISPRKNVKTNDLVISDNINDSNLIHANIFKINFDYFDNFSSEAAYYFPFSMHPDFISQKIDLNIFRKSSRKISLLFAGNIVAEAYQNVSINRLFNIYNRREIIDFVRESYDTYDFHDLALNNLKDFNKKQKIVFATFEYLNGVFLKDQTNKISRENWFKSLSFADFWLCCPGVVMPHCHNTIEAMAVGCIPIIQDESLFQPSLEHNVNCLIFSTLSDLKNVIDSLLKMDENQISTMRNNVIDYYESYLNPSSQIENFMQSKKKNIKMIGGFYSVELLNEKYEKENS